MTDDKFILMSLDDDRAKSLAEVLGNKTCKKIIEYLSETTEASQKDLADFLKAPINTIEYNIKKLLKSGFIQKRKNFFWSKKGKKIVMYELTNKSIIISPKKSVGEKVKSLLPSFIILFAGTVLLWVYSRINSINVENNLNIGYKDEIVGTVVNNALPPILSPDINPLWIWFFLGGVLALLVFSVVNWRKL
ncbi:MAG: winged helix-turn-helix transcriptional regulator [Nanoarchaeota archaeon]|nr:winged helix-turn-helix transcriptional regulator [Nanoarchaeota archaeon]